MALSLKGMGLVTLVIVTLAACGHGNLQAPREINHPSSSTTAPITTSRNPGTGGADRSPSMYRATTLVTPPGAAILVAPAAPPRVAPAVPVQQPAGCGAARSGPPAPQCPPG
jgi:hypothetical protein